jgi:hypothetical protein
VAIARMTPISTGLQIGSLHLPSRCIKTRAFAIDNVDPGVTRRAG